MLQTDYTKKFGATMPHNRKHIPLTFNSQSRMHVSMFCVSLIVRQRPKAKSMRMKEKRPLHSLVLILLCCMVAISSKRRTTCSERTDRRRVCINNIINEYVCFHLLKCANISFPFMYFVCAAYRAHLPTYVYTWFMQIYYTRARYSSQSRRGTYMFWS